MLYGVERNYKDYKQNLDILKTVQVTNHSRVGLTGHQRQTSVRGGSLQCNTFGHLTGTVLPFEPSIARVDLCIDDTRRKRKDKIHYPGTYLGR